MQLLVLTALYLVYLGYREWQHGVHVHDLEMKLMARDAQEYIMLKDAESPKVAVEEKTEPEYIDPFDANPDEFLAARGDGL